MKSRDAFQLAFGWTHLYVFSVRIYGGWSTGHRLLGNNRHALDCGLFSLIFERYTQ